jgi:quercetin dioxygenase-like cupin family protein
MIKNITTADHYRWGGECDGWRLLDRSDLSVIQERIPQGAGEVKHYHERARQLFYALSGNMEIEISGDVHRLAQGDALEVPPGCDHQVRNNSECDVVFLVISAPSTIGDRINLET